jgi:hypothetical protein
MALAAAPTALTGRVTTAAVVLTTAVAKVAVTQPLSISDTLKAKIIRFMH